MTPSVNEEAGIEFVEPAPELKLRCNVQDCNEAMNGKENASEDESDNSSRTVRPKWPEERACAHELMPNLAERLDKRQNIARRASHNGGQQDKTEDLIGSFHPEASGDQHVQSYVSERLEDLEHRLETFLEQMTEEMTQEVEREQQHLMLMQNQVDKQGQMLHRELGALKKKMDCEVARQSFVSSSVRENKEALVERLEQQEQDLAALRLRMSELEMPPLLRVLRSLAHTFGLAQCFAIGAPSDMLGSMRGYSNMQQSQRSIQTIAVQSSTDME